MKNDKQLQSEFGRRVRQLREAKQWAQTDLAYEADIEPGYVSRIELGKVNPSLTVIIALVKALGCQVQDIVVI